MGELNRGMFLPDLPVFAFSFLYLAVNDFLPVSPFQFLGDFNTGAYGVFPLAPFIFLIPQNTPDNQQYFFTSS